jgi:glycerol-3-phosphate acyltransferase PlsX
LAYRVAVDAMGADKGPSVVVPGVLLALQQHPDLTVILVGQEAELRALLPPILPERLVIHHASETIAMDESLAVAMRSKKDSSMRVAINLVKNGEAQACVSAGNTGALMALSRFLLKTLPGISRPAIITELPTTGKKCRVLDLGANVDSSPEQILQFAVMGTILSQAIDQIAKPEVGLLNVGTEEIKGTELVKATSKLLAEVPFINYFGYVEGDDIFRGTVDIVVCDGFVGNIALKASEGTAILFSTLIAREFKRTWYTKLAGLLVKPLLTRIHRYMDPASYNGASLIGLNGIVIKSHGGSSVRGHANAIHQAILEIKYNVPQLIRDQVASILVSDAPE